MLHTSDKPRHCHTDGQGLQRIAERDAWHMAQCLLGLRTGPSVGCLLLPLLLVLATTILCGRGRDVLFFFCVQLPVVTCSKVRNVEMSTTIVKRP